MNYERIAEYSQIASAVLFVLSLVWIWRRFIQPAVLQAQDSANAKIAQAEVRRDEAKAVLDSLQGEIGSAQRDAAAILERAHAQARRESEALIDEARRAGERTVRIAQGELERDRAIARKKLRQDLIDRALENARALAVKRVDAAVDARLVDTFLSSLERPR